MSMSGSDPIAELEQSFSESSTIEQNTSAPFVTPVIHSNPTETEESTFPSLLSIENELGNVVSTSLVQETGLTVGSGTPIQRSSPSLKPIVTSNETKATISTQGFPGRPPVFNPNSAQQTPPGPEYSPRSDSSRKPEEETSLTNEVSQSNQRSDNTQNMKEHPRVFRPRRQSQYQQFLPPAYMFKLLRNRLTGVIMGCTDETKSECLRDLVFGLPAKHWDYLETIPPRSTVYLFNYSRRCLYGLFRAVGSGVWAKKPYGWSGSPTIPTRFPAQIQVECVGDYPCLYEDEYGPILDWKENYINSQKFSFELDKEQVQALNELFQTVKNHDPDREEPPVIVKEKPFAPPHLRSTNGQMRPHIRPQIRPQVRGGKARYRPMYPVRGPGMGQQSPKYMNSAPQHPIARRPAPQCSTSIPNVNSHAFTSTPPGIKGHSVLPPPGMGPPGIIPMSAPPPVVSKGQESLI